MLPHFGVNLSFSLPRITTIVFGLFLLFIDLQFGNMNLFVGHLLCVAVVSNRQQSIFNFTFSFKSSVNSCV